MPFFLRIPAVSPALWFRAFSEVCVRFPAPMLSAAVFTGSFIHLVYRGQEDQQMLRWLLAGLFGIPMGIGLAALSERWSWTGWKRYAVEVLSLLSVVGCHAVFDPGVADWEGVQTPRYFWVLVVAHLWVASAPYLGPGSTSVDFWEYNKRLLTHFFTGALYAAVLFLGLSSAIAAVNALFDLGWDSKVYGYLFGLLAGMFQTAFFLYHFPRQTTFEEDEQGYPPLLRNLGQYVFVPIVALYFLILYAYSAKIILTWQLPRGWVSSLVLGFSVAGIFTYLINYRLSAEGATRWVNIYRRAFWWVLLPMVALLFTAIGRRIADYGVTPERYFVAHTGVWLLVCCLYFLLVKRPDIRFIPLSLGLFILPAIVGPISAFDVSQRSQVRILKTLLEQNSAFQNSLLKRDLSYLPDAERERIRSIVHFLAQQGALHRMEPWMSQPLSSVAPDSLSAYQRAQMLLDWFNATGASNELRFIFLHAVRDPSQPVSIAGFRSLYWIEGLKTVTPEQEKKAPFIGLSENGKMLLVRLQYTRPGVDTLHLEDYLRRCRNFGQSEDAQLPDSLSTIEWQKRQRSYRLMVREIGFDKQSLSISSIGGALLVK